MSERLGRNDPCHCGSGKKYKRCHLAADEARERDEARAEAEAMARALSRYEPPEALPVLPPRPEPPPLSPEEQHLEEVWEAFELAGSAARISHFEAALADERTDAELAFGMLDLLHADAVERGDRSAFRAQVQRLRGHRPELYEADRLWYLSWQIEDAAVEGAFERLPELVMPLADLVDQDIDEILRLTDLLMFHDQTEPLRGMLLRAWPAVSRSTELLPSIIAEFVTPTLMLTLYRHLEAGGAPRLEDPTLASALGPLGDLDIERTQMLLDALSGVALRDWTPDDFIKGPEDEPGEEPAAEEAEGEPDGIELFDEDDGGFEEDDEVAATPAPLPETPLRGNLFVLSAELAGWLRRDHGIPFSRTEVAREMLVFYLWQRPADRDGRLRLLPDKQSLDRRLAGLMSFLSGQYYKAATLFGIVPLYIDMLVARGLVSRDAARRARRDILTLRSQVRRVVTEAIHDPALSDFVAHAGEGSGPTPQPPP